MNKVIECPCGWTVRANHDAIIEKAKDHAEKVHQMELTDEQVRAMARPE